jgi:hypothetical protein
MPTGFVPWCMWRYYVFQQNTFRSCRGVCHAERCSEGSKGAEPSMPLTSGEENALARCNINRQARRFGYERVRLIP